LDDVLAKRVRFIGDPSQRIAKTICASQGFSAFTPPMAPVSPIAPATLPASRREQALRPSPPKRVRMEMLKLMVAEGAPGAVAAMADGGLLLPIFGGVAYMGPFTAMISAERLLGLERARFAARRAGGRRHRGARRLATRLRLTNPKPRRSIPWAIAGGGSRHGRGDARRLALPLGESVTATGDVGVGAGRSGHPFCALARTCHLAAALECAEISLKAADFIARGIAEGPRSAGARAGRRRVAGGGFSSG